MKKTIMKLNVKNTISITAFLISQVMSSQFYVGLQSGAASILSNVKATSASYELGGAIKVGYIYSLSNHIGIGTGIEFSQYKQDVFLSNSSATLSNFEVDPS